MSSDLLGCILSNTVRVRGDAMHSFSELIDRCSAFTLGALRDAQAKTLDALQTSGATTHVKTLQMVQLQKVISAVGMFSLFDAMLQDGLECADGFREAAKILVAEGDEVLRERFSNLQLAINVFKHGRGRSYTDLLAKETPLPFKIKRLDDHFFDEGDVAEVSTLIEVDDAFVISCAETIRDVSAVIRRARPGFFA